MLPWNSRFRVILPVLLLLCTLFPQAQESEEPVVTFLLRGPVRTKGLDFLPPNALPVEYGQYDYSRGNTEVFFTREQIYLSSAWGEEECGGYDLAVLTGEEKRVLAYRDSGGWTVFIAFDPAENEYCRFTEEFLRRLRYFIGIARDTSTVSFPAVLTLR